MARIKRYSPQEKAAYNERKQAEINDLIKRIDEGVQAVFESERYKEYLKFASMFTDYSARNTMLINLQKPHATFVASYGKWKKLGRQVERGEKGIIIFAPIIYETDQYSTVLMPVLDKKGNPIFNEDGTVKTYTIEKPLSGISFKKVYVYDVSQTSGKEIPKLADELTGDIDVEKKEAIFTALKKVTGIDFEFRDLKSDVKGFYNHAEDRIVIKSGMSDTQTLKTAFHETAHKLLHDPKLEIVTVKSPRNEKEVQAESVAFMVAERLGLDTSEYSLNDVSITDRKVAETIQLALGTIFSEADSSCYKDISKMYYGGKNSLYYSEEIRTINIESIFRSLSFYLRNRYKANHYKEKLVKFSAETGIALNKNGLLDVTVLDNPKETIGANPNAANGKNSPSTIIYKTDFSNIIVDGEIFPKRYYCINFSVCGEGTNEISVGKISSISPQKNHAQYRSATIKEMKQRCRLYNEFVTGKKMLNHEELFGISTNLVFPQ